MSELGCDADKIVTVGNKCDKLEGQIAVDPDGEMIMVSAHSGFGLDRLLDKIENKVCSTVKLNLIIPYDKMDVIAKIRKNGTVVSEEYAENGVEVNAFVDKKDLYIVKDFAV